MRGFCECENVAVELWAFLNWYFRKNNDWMNWESYGGEMGNMLHTGKWISRQLVTGQNEWNYADA